MCKYNGRKLVEDCFNPMCGAKVLPRIEALEKQVAELENKEANKIADVLGFPHIPKINPEPVHTNIHFESVCTPDCQFNKKPMRTVDDIKIRLQCVIDQTNPAFDTGYRMALKWVLG